MGDKVSISTEGIELKGQPSGAFWQRYIGPFKIVEKLSPLVYRLSLPAAMKRIHPVIHISKLRKWRDDRDYPERCVSEAEAAEHADIARGELRVKEILGYGIGEHPKYKTGSALVFHVHWEGHDDPGSHTWEPYAAVKGLQQLDDLLATSQWKRFVRSQAYRQFAKEFPARVPPDTGR